MNTFERDFQTLLDDPQYRLIPRELLNGLKRYVEDRIKTGSFLQAVLENNLFETVGRCGLLDMKALKQLVIFIFNEMPGDSWGSKTAVEKWLKHDTRTSD